MITDAFRNHPGQALTVGITAVGLIAALVLLGRAWLDDRAPLDAEADFMARHNLLGELIHVGKAVVLLALAINGLVTAVNVINALPPPLRPAALVRSRQLSPAMIRLVVFYVALVALNLLNSARGFIGRWLFNRKFGPDAAKRLRGKG